MTTEKKSQSIRSKPSFFLALLRDDGHARLHMIIGCGFLACWLSCMEGALHSALFHAHRKRGLVLALGRYHLDLSFPVVVSDQQALVTLEAAVSP